MFGLHTGLTVEAALAVLSIWCTFPYVKRQVGTRDDSIPDVPSNVQQLFKDGSALGDQPTAAQQQEFAEWLRAVAAVVGDRGQHWALRKAAIRALYGYANGTREAEDCARFHAADGAASLVRMGGLLPELHPDFDDSVRPSGLCGIL